MLLINVVRSSPFVRNDALSRSQLLPVLIRMVFRQLLLGRKPHDRRLLLRPQLRFLIICLAIRVTMSQGLYSYIRSLLHLISFALCLILLEMMCPFQ